MTTALEDLLARHVETGTIQGAVALLGRGDDVEVAAVGVASDDGLPMPADAIMRIQSMTKVITAVAALRLVESGRLGLDQSVEEWLPELANRRVLISPTAPLGAALLGATAGATVAYQAPNGELRVRVLKVETA